MSASNEFQTVDVIELRCDLVSEQPARTARRNSPRLDVLGVAPNEITEGAFVRNLLCASHDADLVDSADLGAQSAVDAEDFAIYDCCENEEVEDLAAGLPDGGVAVFLLAFFIESVDLGDLSGLVVASNESDSIGVSVAH